MGPRRDPKITAALGAYRARARETHEAPQQQLFYGGGRQQELFAGPPLRGAPAPRGDLRVEVVDDAGAIAWAGALGEFLTDNAIRGKAAREIFNHLATGQAVAFGGGATPISRLQPAGQAAAQAAAAARVAPIKAAMDKWSERAPKPRGQG